ncbi:uncharacterized protein LOC141632416 [Silene latifolia]|uniref:uncharacterized protein LOC141632416 n=1 Tax=Silene latifolia TaxID=37657 RepID=UPI003D7725C2
MEWLVRQVKDEVLKVSGCVEGAMPFRYLGIPINPSKLSKKECQIMADNILDKIRCFGTRKLSYGGRLSLVNFVLTGLYSYWANIFLIPNGVLRKIDAYCRNYLWDGSSDYSRAHMVKWEWVCSPKREGGLGVKYSLDWNVAAIGKLVWWIYTKPDSLWVKRVNQICIKGVDWASYQPKTHMGWNLKTICKVKDLMQPSYSMGQWTANPKGYRIHEGYHWIRTKQQPIGWYKLVWHSRCLPKHRFLIWLIMRNALNVKDKLFRHGICLDDLCCLCGTASETGVHLFHQCVYSQGLVAGMASFIHIPVPSANAII